MSYELPKLREEVIEVLVGLGEKYEQSEWTADCLIKADMRGISTHGVHLLKSIAQRTHAGMLNLPTNIDIIMNDEATAILDGNNGLGTVAGHVAINMCIEKAKDYGIGIVLIRNTNNIGSLAYYAEIAAGQNMIALISCNAAPAMAPWGGAEPFVGTNPIAISIPTTENQCFIADMATSVVARGKIRKASRENVDIPLGWALDNEGQPTIDPRKALDGTLLPMGGPKGSSLAMAIDLISGLLSGSSYGPNLKSFHELKGPTGVGASCIVIDVGRFMVVDHFKELIDAYITSAKFMNKAQEFNEILMPGEIELQKEQQSLVGGVTLEDQTVKSLNEILDVIRKMART